VKRLLALPLFALLLVVPLATPPSASGAPADQAAPTAHDHANHHHGPDGMALDRRQFRGAKAAQAATYEVDAHADWSKVEWDGNAFTADQRDVDGQAGQKQVHAIYVYPARAQSRFLQFAAMFQADARQANDLLADTRGRGIRFDERVGADKVTRYLDITVFQSKYRANQLAGSNQFSLVANELAAKFNAPNKKYVAWLDAGSQYCGQGTLYQDTRRDPAVNGNNVSRTTGIVYRPYTASDPATGGFCRGRTLLHELGHNLGALQSVAPNDFDGAHCNDSGDDVMCYPGAAEALLGSVGADNDVAVFDHGSDDYWDPDGGALTYWTVNLSSFLCPVGVRSC